MRSHESDGETVVARPAWEFALVWFGFPLAGAAVGWFAQPLAQWALGLDWVPMQGPLELVESIPEPLGRIVLVTAGLIAGVAVSLSAEGELLRVAVSDRRIRLSQDGDTRELDRGSVTAVFMDGKDLVILGPGTAELARRRNDRDAGRLGRAFTAHGYPWRADGDPHHDEYRRWVPDTPDLPGAVNAVLRAREGALERDDAEDVAELRSELGHLGFVIRDDGTRQHWRRVSGWGA